jgi:O-antigen ligase
MHKSIFNLASLTSKIKPSAKQLFVFSLVISPLFLLTVKGWMTRIVVVSCLLAIYLVYKCYSKSNKPSLNTKYPPHLGLLSAMFVLPFLAIFLAQSFRGQYSWAYYDSPAHILICVFVMLAMVKAGPRVVELMSYTFPIANLLALANILINPNLFWGPARLSTQALDPLAFGSLSLTFGILSLISIKLHRSKSKLLVLYKLAGFCAGIYLSIISGSRTGWLALPIVGFLWLHLEHVKFTLPAKTIAVASLITIIISSYFLSENVHQRTNMAVREVTDYHWNEPNTDTSVGDRISFARIAIFLLEKKPLSGWGDGNFASVINDPALNFAAAETKSAAVKSGLHNEISANMVRSGIWGLISSVALFLIPALYFLNNARSKPEHQRNVALLGLAFLTCQFVSSLSMELLNLRYAASFYGLMLSIFCGQLLFYASQNINNLSDQSQ